MTKPDKTTKDDARYEQGWTQNCAGCANWRGNNTCALVAGIISPHATCSQWSRP